MNFTIIALAVAGVVVLVMVALIYRVRPASITGFSWERSIDIYDEHWVQRSSYGAPPAGSRNHRSKTVYTTRTVSKCKPELTTEYVFGESRTVYKHKYRPEQVAEPQTLHTYEVPKRRYSHTVRESGSSRDGVAWPKATGHVGARKQRYTVEFVGLDGKHHTTNVSEKRWRALDEDAAYLLSVTWYGFVLRIRTEHA